MLHYCYVYERVCSMKKLLRNIFFLCLTAVLLVSQFPKVFADTLEEPYRPDLRAFLQDPEYRDYVETMVDYHLRTDPDIRNALEGGFAAVFLFDGCSDNMNDPELSDLSYYRVSGVCLVIKLDANGQPKLIYFNEDASTIPDQPLKYGAWEIPEIGEVGPATVFDGTYQIYSVQHRGEYEALHVRTDFYDGTLDAVYLTPDGGYTTYRASEINVHTRTSNHIAGYGMWSAGCPLVGDGNAWDFKRLFHSAYYTTYDTYEVFNFMGTLTIDRQQLRQELYTLYKNPDAVDAFLKNSREVQPDAYWKECSEKLTFQEMEIRYTNRETKLMSLPCTREEDARTKVLKTLPKGEKLSVTGSIRNGADNKWYVVSHEGVEGYLFTGDTKPESWMTKFRDLITGK